MFQKCAEYTKNKKIVTMKNNPEWKFFIKVFPQKRHFSIFQLSRWTRRYIIDGDKFNFSIQLRFFLPQ